MLELLQSSKLMTLWKRKKKLSEGRKPSKHHAAKQEKVNIGQAVAIDMLRTENAELRAKISAVEAAVARLSLVPPAPIRSRSRSPEHHAFNTRPRSPLPRMYQAPRDTRARSQSAETPCEAKRQRYSEPDDPPMITMGPFPPTSMSALSTQSSRTTSATRNHIVLSAIPSFPTTCTCPSKPRRKSKRSRVPGQSTIGGIE
ncbi:hypothetical protein C8J57DRAFT_1222116 [Mycena rebaudengoi]|nr:hypothetical protein C8J57DRAFT_1222116 [Mycena rebaudengoi]